jgi:hypothetical protein
MNRAPVKMGSGKNCIEHFEKSKEFRRICGKLMINGELNEVVAMDFGDGDAAVVRKDSFYRTWMREAT